MKDRRIKNRSRGTVPWYEAYERRKHPYIYKERSISMVRTIMCIVFTIALFVLFGWTYMMLYVPTVKPVEPVQKEEQTVDMGIWSEDNQGNSLAGKGDDIEHFQGN